MIEQVREHLPADVELTGAKTAHGYSLRATRGDRSTGLFIRDGQPVDHRQAALNMVHFL